MENPFKYGGIVRGPYFADRTEELSELIREMTNLSKVFLISPRRLGKTCLLFNLMDRLRDLGFATGSLDSLTKKGLLFKTLKGAYKFSDTFMPYWISDLKRTEK